MEEENKFFLKRFEQDKKEHKEKMEQLLAHIKLSEKNREIEKKRYKKKIESLKNELQKLKQRPEEKATTIDLVSDSSDDQKVDDDAEEAEANKVPHLKLRC